MYHSTCSSVRYIQFASCLHLLSFALDTLPLPPQLSVWLHAATLASCVRALACMSDKRLRCCAALLRSVCSVCCVASFHLVHSSSAVSLPSPYLIPSASAWYGLPFSTAPFSLASLSLCACISSQPASSPSIQPSTHTSHTGCLLLPRGRVPLQQHCTFGQSTYPSMSSGRR